MNNREIDALVAEKAFGWKWVEVPPDASGQNAGRALVSLGYIEALRRNDIDWPKRGRIEPLSGVTAYSTDAAASDALLEEMRKRGWAWAVYGGPAGFSARFFRDVFDESAFSAGSDDSPRRAICEAALKALGVQVD